MWVERVSGPSSSGSKCKDHDTHNNVIITYIKKIEIFS